MGGQNNVKIWATDLESEALEQIYNVSKLPFIFKHVAVMPDAHAGKGSTIGTVIATKGAIIPAAVGVDIGCGMCAVKLPFKIDVFGDSLNVLRASIERSIPVGFNQHRQTTPRIENSFKNLYRNPSNFKDKLVQEALHQLGTLGGGNHFIELCHDENNNAWVMLHSGSRNLGKTLAEHHINQAKGLMKSGFIDLPSPDLAYLIQETPEFNHYIDDLLFAQNYAQANREEMMQRVLREVSYYLFKEDRGADSLTTLKVNCHHNYSSMENHFGKNVWITRKGAVSARAGELGIIPGSMGAKSYIVKGKGNPDSFCSCSHGAGRRMSRTKAKSIFTIEDLKKQTLGIECRKDTTVIDEIPSAYKDIETVMENQKNLVDIIYTLKQVMCIKG